MVLIKCFCVSIIFRPDNCMCAEWEQWTEYGPCTAHCGGGRKSRSRIRQCKNINSDLEKSQLFICIKNVTQYQVCNTQECGKLSICTYICFLNYFLFDSCIGDSFNELFFKAVQILRLNIYRTISVCTHCIFQISSI